MEQKVRYHLIEPGTPEFEVAKELYEAVNAFNQKYEILMAQFQSEMQILNNKYMPITADLRKKVFAMYSDRDPEEIEKDGSMGVVTQFFEDTGIFLIAERSGLLPENLAKLMEFDPPMGGKAN